MGRCQCGPGGWLQGGTAWGAQGASVPATALQGSVTPLPTSQVGCQRPPCGRARAEPVPTSPLPCGGCHTPPCPEGTACLVSGHLPAACLPVRSGPLRRSRVGGTPQLRGWDRGPLRGDSVEEEVQSNSGARISRGYCIPKPPPSPAPSPVTLSRDSSAGCREAGGREELALAKGRESQEEAHPGCGD